MVQSAQAGSSAIDIRDASISYPSEQGSRLLAVDNLDFHVEPGQFVSVLGPSGCGKSSMLKAIAGLVPLTSGTIVVGGKPVTGPGLSRAVVFQDPALLPWRTIKANVELGLEALSLSRSERSRVSSEYLELVGLGGFEKAYPHQLSGGMRQRVGIARALAVEPEVLLMDEPFAALDAQTRERMATELLRIWAQQQKTVVFITHSIEEAIHLADRVVLMSFRPGRVLKDVCVDLGRPRDAAIRGTSEFAELRQQLWEELTEEVKKAEDEETRIGS